MSQRQLLTGTKFAIRSGNCETVELLLKHGADPNQTYGSLATSPLNSAFFMGRPDIVRPLLTAGADLKYVNEQGWTNLNYIWDPERSNHSTVAELIAICGPEIDQEWRLSDFCGCTPIHRAAGFGNSDHIRTLCNMRVLKQDNLPLTNAYWCPLMCAAAFGNLSTFKKLVEMIYTHPALLKREDRRGWNLLHLAAMSGSQAMLSHLLLLGFNPKALTSGANFMLPKELEFQELTARVIARFYHYEEIYNDALRAAGKWDDFVAENEKETREERLIEFE
jgi:ankyrin repeat protein